MDLIILLSYTKYNYFKKSLPLQAIKPELDTEIRVFVVTINKRIIVMKVTHLALSDCFYRGLGS